MDAKHICVIGLGGAGCRMVGHLAATARDGPVLAAVSTDRRALSESAAPKKVRLGGDRTRGGGAGGDVATGRRAAEDDRAQIEALVAGMELVFLVVGLGGGTGTGAAPVVLRAAREAGALTLCFATLPFAFEGAPRTEAAEAVLPELRALSDALIVMPNDRLAARTSGKRLPQAFTAVEQTVGVGLRGLWKLLTHPGYIQVDFAGLRGVMASAAGRCTFAIGEGKGKNRVATALKMCLEHPLLDGGALLREAASVLVSIGGGPELTLKEVGEIMDAIHGATGPDCRVTMGTVVDEVCHDRLALVAVVAEGRAAPEPAPDAVPAPKPARSARKPLQTKLAFDTTRGRFQNVEPTLHDGEDLDVPTVTRRGIKL
jgi:cell division protein FtsZ